MRIGRYTQITIMSALLSLLACPPALANNNGLADIVALKISRLFAVFKAPVLEISEGRVYLAIRRSAPPAPGALAEIINSTGVRVGLAKIISVSDKFATADIIKSYGVIHPGHDTAIGVRRPARILWISAGGQDKQTSALLSSIEEAVRELGSVDLVASDVAHFITARHPGIPPSALPEDELVKTAATTGSDFIMLVSVTQEDDNHRSVLLALLDNTADHLLEITGKIGAPADSRQLF